jgi:UDP-N-acetylglucosamine 2-epimerase (non-hydrolysing)
VTLHRPANVDGVEALGELLGVLTAAAERLPLVWPLHPRTRALLDRHGLWPRIERTRLQVVAPMGYTEFLGLMAGARVTLTDSGGIQEETTALGVRCLTLRENTERPVTVTEGTNRVVGTEPARILAALDAVLSETCGRHPSPHRLPEGWDGRAAQRIVAVIRKWGKAGGRPSTGAERP